MTYPILETERLILRGHRLGDLSRTTALWADPEVTRYIGGKPLTAEESWSRFLRYRGHWSLLGFGFWLVEEKLTGAFVGEVGFTNAHREITPPLEDLPELGWVLAPSMQGKGYATEAVQAAIQWGSATFGSGDMVSIIHPDHAASIAVALRCAFLRQHVAAYLGHPTLVFRRFASGSESRS